MIGGTDYQVVQTHEFDGHRVQLLRWNPRNEEWRCDCEEYLTIKPLTPRAWCRHVAEAAGTAPKG